ncbi:hypothetical protein LWE61_03830 [Sphingobium sufflavum]|uniref:hypothetical protein n=1 Tax=Sphingobium sufflavum TaxID=1129547 RepID=UPI001F439921|nr:hypothetical protein [Sphingobium sufflavum]MCE7795684.1 hypothetical protein [Sphingobium sufflavum]
MNRYSIAALVVVAALSAMLSTGMSVDVPVAQAVAAVGMDRHAEQGLLIARHDGLTQP